ncbi:MAG: tetratricopeptide repeat protein [Armatimonadetes bacterium]|nr:tetratricopeptide repeat protein [Armatimonadota bacterium]
MKQRFRAWAALWLLTASVVFAKPPQSYDEGNALYRQGDFAGAKAKFQQAVADGFDKAATHYKIGLCERKLGNYEAALASFEQALRIEPGYASRSNIGKMMADVQAKLGRTESARPVQSAPPPRSNMGQPAGTVQGQPMPAPAQQSGGFSWGWIVLILLAVWVVWLLSLRAKKKSIEPLYKPTGNLGGADKGRLSDENARLASSLSGSRQTFDPAPSARPKPRAACFFCSRPETESPLRTVTLDTDRGNRRVLACQDCADDIQEGKSPGVRSVYYNDRYVPWYDVPDYDPALDYRSPRWQIGLMDMMLLDTLLHHHSHPAPVAIFANDDPYYDRQMEDAAAYSFDHDTSVDGTAYPGGTGMDLMAGDRDMGDDQS